MNVADTFKMLLRRWYILLVGLVLAGGTVAAVWTQVPPRYERTSTQVLLPGKASLPQDGQNPYLYIGGLTLAADVVVRAVGSDNVAKEFDEVHPGVGIQVSRDPTTAGPVVLTSVSATDDEVARIVLQQLTQRTALVLNQLQQAEAIPKAQRMTIVTLTVDEHGVIRDRSRLMFSAVAGLAVVLLAVLAAALTEGIGVRRRRKRAEHGTEESTSALDPKRALTEDAIPDSAEPESTAAERDQTSDTSESPAEDETPVERREEVAAVPGDGSNDESSTAAHDAASSVESPDDRPDSAQDSNAAQDPAPSVGQNASPRRSANGTRRLGDRKPTLTVEVEHSQ